MSAHYRYGRSSIDNYSSCFFGTIVYLVVISDRKLYDLLSKMATKVPLIEVSCTGSFP